MMHSKPLPSQTTLKQLFDYNPETGELLNKISRGNAKAGTSAGSVTKHGYFQIQVQGKFYRRNRLIWMWMTGLDPGPWLVDHIDQDKLNDRWDNLRLASDTTNRGNQKTRKDNTSGFRGVSYHSQAKKWSAEISFRGKRIRLGLFDTPLSAAEAYNSEAAKLFGEFARLNFVP